MSALSLHSAEPTPGAMCWRLAFLAAAFIAPEALFWYSADFAQFVPPGEGSSAERTWYFAYSIGAPIIAVVRDPGFATISLLALLLGMIATGIAGSRYAGLRLLSYVTVAGWLFGSCSLASLRIT